MSVERWKDVLGYEGAYQVSDHGRVRSSRYSNKLLKLKKNPQTGYLEVHLSLRNNPKKFRIHRLVMLSFIGTSQLEVDHIDGDKENNHLSNLEYVTGRENRRRYNLNRKINKQIIKDNPKSDYPGVTWSSCRKMWRARKKYKGKVYELGMRRCEVEAYMLVKEAASKIRIGIFNT